MKKKLKILFYQVFSVNLHQTNFTLAKFPFGKMVEKGGLPPNKTPEVHGQPKSPRKNDSKETNIKTNTSKSPTIKSNIQSSVGPELSSQPPTASLLGGQKHARPPLTSSTTSPQAPSGARPPGFKGAFPSGPQGARPPNITSSSAQRFPGKQDSNSSGAQNPPNPPPPATPSGPRETNTASPQARPPFSTPPAGGPLKSMSLKILSTKPKQPEGDSSKKTNPIVTPPKLTFHQNQVLPRARLAVRLILHRMNIIVPLIISLVRRKY